MTENIKISRIWTPYNNTRHVFKKCKKIIQFKSMVIIRTLQKIEFPLFVGSVSIPTKYLFACNMSKYIHL